MKNMKTVRRGKRRNKNEKSKRGVLIIAFILLLLLIILLLQYCTARPMGGDYRPDVVPKFDLSIDDSAADIVGDDDSFKVAQDRVNAIVKKNYLNITVNTTPVMENGNAEGNFRLKNSEANHYTVIAEIVEKHIIDVDTSNMEFKLKAKRDYTKAEKKQNTPVYESLNNYNQSELEVLTVEIEKQLYTKLNLKDSEVISFNIKTIPIKGRGEITVEHMLYRSKGIPVGKMIENTKLDYVLDKGTHDCIVYYNAFEPKTGTFIGKAGVEIKITVQN